MTRERLNILLENYRLETISEAERVELATALASEDDTADIAREIILQELYASTFTTQTDLKPLYNRISAAVAEETVSITPVHRIHFLRRSWVRYAAAIALFAIATTVFVVNRKSENKTVVVAYKGDVAAPRNTKATLTRGNGEQIILDSIATGSTIASATKTLTGLVYKGTGESEYQTLTNPKGSQPISLTLADGSVVTLNAASSIHFPTAFPGATRAVEITGEAYFEVVHNAAKPFQVKAGNQIIEDIGTSFNVNAYSDEPAIKTTLIEGSVKINNTILKPGQQYNNGKVEVADVTQVMAWKNGFFGFDHADIHTVMRQLSRWYDVEVRFEGQIDNEPFQGKIGRGLTLATVLKNLEQMHVHFRIEEDKRIVIIP